jgi:acetylornithine deacetylase/succinyl-diaminopimelate desuccinylase-like protein
VFATVSLLLFPPLGCSRREAPISGAESERATRSAESWLSEEPVRLLRDYVRIDTTEARGEEEGARFLQRFFDCAGIESEILCPAPKRCNVFARLPGRSRQGALLLLNHIDVAPVVTAFWKEGGPFEGKIERGYLYGRGTYDMKSIGIAQALGMRALKSHGIVPPSDILFLGEADEEIGQRWGARWLLDNKPELFSGVTQVLNEGGTIELILREPRSWGIEALQAGYAMAEFEAPAAAPLEALADRWRKLDSPAVEPHPQVTIGFDFLANHLPYPLTDQLRHPDRVRRNRSELSTLPDRYGGFLEARASWSPVYPAGPARKERRRYVVVSTPPGMAPARFLDPILEDARRGGISLVLSFAGEESAASPYPTPFTELLRRVTEARYPGIPIGPVPTFGGYTTSVLFRRRGFPTYGYSTIPMNITDSARRHRNNERIYLPDYVAGVQLYQEILEEFALATPGVRELSVLGQRN